MPESSTPVQRSLVAGGRHLAEVLDDLAEAFEHTAQLAEEHAARRAAQVDQTTRDTERRRSALARNYAALARRNADRIRRSVRELGLKDAAGAPAAERRPPVPGGARDQPGPRNADG
jgi:hypothetical protein